MENTVEKKFLRRVRCGASPPLGNAAALNMPQGEQKANK
jgi:hypothetical protein